MKATALYAGLALAVAGCTTTSHEPVTLTPIGKSALSEVVRNSEAPFHSHLQQCFNDSETSVFVYKKPTTQGTYNRETGERGISLEAFITSFVDGQTSNRYAFHEAIHRQVSCGNIDVERLYGLYEAMHPNDYPIKLVVEERLQLYEGLSYTDLQEETVALLLEEALFSEHELSLALNLEIQKIIDTKVEGFDGLRAHDS